MENENPKLIDDSLLLSVVTFRRMKVITFMKNELQLVENKFQFCVHLTIIYLHCWLSSTSAFIINRKHY